MYQRILIPTDGSEASLRAIDAGIALAKMLHAEVVALSVAPEFHVLSLAPSQVEQPAAAFASEQHALAMHKLHDVSHAARAAGVPCTCEFMVSDHPWEAICARKQPVTSRRVVAAHCYSVGLATTDLQLRGYNAAPGHT